MKFKINSTINYDDVDFNNKTFLSTIARLQQKSATFHSDSVGYTNDFFIENGLTWVLHKLHIKIFKYPVLYDNYDFFTWSKGAKGYFAFRDFNMIVNNKIYVAGSGVWLLIDVNKKRPVRVSKEMVDRYTTEAVSSIDTDILKFKVFDKGEKVYEKIYKLRYRDFDRNRHLNNAVYIEFIEDIVFEVFDKYIKEIKIIYEKEIPSSIKEVNVILKKEGDSLFFFIGNYACGELFV
ncbi:thioesterase [Deferribacter thermophilus]|uniref:acyl-[acyl-carrier-protein] thioesterase n=1 Tax=Deferribacter thermophilus TaxID=53573 RepID=UPI003C2744C0